MATRMRQRRGTASQWTSANPILGSGELGWESDTNKFKIGDGTNHWADLAYFVDQDTVTTSLGDYVETSTLGQPDGVATLDSTGQIPVSQLGNIIDGAPGVLDTINEIAAAINDDPTFFTTVATNLSNHESDTTNVHGIADTAELATKTYADSAVSTHSSDTTNVHGIADTADLATKSYADNAVSTHSSDTTSIHGIADTSKLVTDDGSQTLTNKTISSTNNTISVTVSNVTDLSASAAELNVLDGITASTAELNILDGVTTSTTELNILDGATLDTTELNYVDGVTSPIQTQLDAKLDKSGGTMTGDITLAGAPTQALHAATKAYVDAVTEGLHIHPSCQAATTTNVAIATDLEPGDIVDGVTLAEGDRVLVKAQTNAAQNGIYVVQASGAALRASDFNEPQEVDGGDFVFVTGGTLYDNTGWVQTTTNVVTIGTDPIVFTQFSGAGTYTAGTGLELNGTVFSIDTGTTVDISTAQTLTNKTISAVDNTLTIATTDLTDVTASAAEINILDGATLSTSELNILDGVTATTSEINTLAGITASTAELNILDGVTASASEINILDGATLTTAELNYVDGVTSAIQTQLDSKLASSTASSTYAPIGSPTFTGTVVLPSTTSIGTVSNIEIGYLDGVTSAIQTQLDAKAVYPAQTGNNGKYLTTNGSNVSWGTVSAYSAPTLGITSIASGATVTTVEALGLKHSQLISPKEKVNVIAGAPGAFITLYADTAGVYYYTSNATTNFGVTFDFSASFDLNFKMAIGESITFVLLVTNGATAYYPTSYSVVFTSVTPKWQGGTAPTGGNINSIDAYSYTIIKTANNTFTVLASQTKFA